jgi:hypothetical protein
MTNKEIVDAALSVASIVRCVDCKHFSEWDKPSDRHGDCKRRTSAGDGIIVKKDWFCAGGERHEQTSN